MVKVMWAARNALAAAHRSRLRQLNPLKPDAGLLGVPGAGSCDAAWGGQELELELELGWSWPPEP